MDSHGYMVIDVTPSGFESNGGSSTESWSERRASGSPMRSRSLAAAIDGSDRLSSRLSLGDQPSAAGRFNRFAPARRHQAGSQVRQGRQHEESLVRFRVRDLQPRFGRGLDV